MPGKHTAPNMAGKVCGRLTVVSRNGSADNGAALWLCECSCGREVTVLGSSLRKGSTKSCGCLNREQTIARNQQRSVEGALARKRIFAQGGPSADLLHSGMPLSALEWARKPWAAA